MATEVCECVGSQLAVFLRQSAGCRQKGRQVMVPALSCCYMPSFTRHLQESSYAAIDIMLSGCSSPPLLVPFLFPFSGPVFIFPIHWTCTPQNTSAPSSSAFLAVLCLTKTHALVSSPPSSTIHTVLTQRIVGIVVQQKMERRRQWEA